MQLHTAHYGNANVFGYSIHTENWHTVINIHSKYGRNSNCSMEVFSLGMLSMLNTVRVCWGSIWMCRNRLFKGKDVNICAPLWVGTPSVVCWITKPVCAAQPLDKRLIDGKTVIRNWLLRVGGFDSLHINLFLLSCLLLPGNQPLLLSEGCVLRVCRHNVECCKKAVIILNSGLCPYV